MNNKEYSVLILGNFENVYVIQFVKNLKKINPNVHLSFWGYTRKEKNIDRSFLECYDDYCLFDINSLINTSIGWKIKAIKCIRKSFKSFVGDRHFDYINIHYIKPEYCFLIDYFKKFASKLVLTPWGSDVYWAHGLNKHLVRRTFNAADFLTGCDDRFTRDFKEIFNVPQSKIVFCDLGVEPIDYILDNKNELSCKEAKQQLGLDNHFVITCGYKALDSHQHLKIIEAIQKVKAQLPENLILLFPLTYPCNPDYIQEIKNKVKEYGLKAVYFEKFLDVPHLFLIRQATDLFIHVQPTDASSGTLYEYILCEKKILNGSWLQYPEIEQYGAKPYYPVESMDTLGEAIVNAVNSEPIHIDERVLTDLAKKQWKVVIKDWDKFFLANRNHE